MVANTCRYYSWLLIPNSATATVWSILPTRISAGVCYHPYLLFTCIISIDCKITNFTLYLFLLFENIVIRYGWLIGAYNMNGWCVSQGLIIGLPISQYTSYSAMFCLLHSNISKEQHGKHLCSSSNHYRKYGKYTHETWAPYLDTWKPWCLNISNVELVS